MMSAEPMFQTSAWLTDTKHWWRNWSVSAAVLSCMTSPWTWCPVKVKRFWMTGFPFVPTPPLCDLPVTLYYKCFILYFINFIKLRHFYHKRALKLLWIIHVEFVIDLCWSCQLGQKFAFFCTFMITVTKCYGSRSAFSLAFGMAPCISYKSEW